MSPNQRAPGWRYQPGSGLEPKQMLVPWRSVLLAFWVAVVWPLITFIAGVALGPWIMGWWS